MNNYLLVLIIVVLSLVMGGVTTHYVIDKPKMVQVLNTVTVHDTTKGALKFKFVPVKVGLTMMQMDSIYEEAKKWALSQQVTPIYISHPEQNTFGLFVLSKDTTYSDSALIAHTEVRSRIALDPKLRFYLDYTVKPKTITVTEPPSSFGFIRGIIAGPSYDFTRKTFGLSITLGFGLKF